LNETRFAVAPFDIDGDRADSLFEFDRRHVRAALDHVFARQNKSRADRRVPGHRQFLARREDADAIIVRRVCGGKTKVVSDKFNSLAMRCIVSAGRRARS
jgi:hypothetical protein